jgi:hypothetical protein
VNTDLLRRIADAIEASPERFDMGQFYGQRVLGDKSLSAAKFDGFASCECGTTACVAGWAVYLAAEATTDTHYRAAELLHITRRQAWLLFYVDKGWWPHDPTAAEAVTTLRALADGTIPLPGGAP